MERILPRSPFLHDPTGELTPQQRGAVDWSFAINSCLRRGMASHSRCGACTMLLGPGHTEPGIDGFCATHSESEPLPPVPVNVVPDDVMAWIAGSAAH